MAPNINNPGGVKNDPDEIRDGVVTDATRFPGGFIDEQITEAGAPVQIVGKFQLNAVSLTDTFGVGSQDSRPTGLTFRPDGTQMYLTGNSNDDLIQYSLSTAFDVSTASFDLSFNVSARDGKPEGIALKPDGTQLYFIGSDNNNVYQYSLSTAFDISTRSFVRSFDVSTQDGGPSGLAFKPDGSRLYVSGNNNDDIYQYNLSTAFDISTASFIQAFDVGTQEPAPTGLTFKPDGSQMYVTGTSNDNAYQYSLSTAFDISTASFTQSFDVSTQDTRPQEIAFSPDGSRLYISGKATDTIYQYAVGLVGAE